MPDPARSTAAPALLAVAHGSADPAAANTIEALLDRVRELRPELAVRAAYLEAAQPSVEASLTVQATPVVVLPLLLAAGYHANVDIPRTVTRSRVAEARIGAVLGPHPLLAEALRDRLVEAGWRGADAVVLGAAGSADPATALATEEQARLLADLVGDPVLPGYASAASPDVATAVATLRSAGADRVAVASYLLAPGHFQSVLAAAGADVLSAPLGSHRAVAELVLARYDQARYDQTRYDQARHDEQFG